jgi:hypothetical protein
MSLLWCRICAAVSDAVSTSTCPFCQQKTAWSATPVQAPSLAFTRDDLAFLKSGKISPR